MIVTLLLIWGGYHRWHWKRITSVIISALITQMIIDDRTGYAFDKNSAHVLVAALLFYWLGRGVGRIIRGKQTSEASSALAAPQQAPPPAP
jgi:hypothetical protein